MKASRLGEMLLEAGLIDQFQLESALSMQRNLGGRIGSALVKLGYLPEETIMDFLESQSKFSRVSLQDLEIPAALLEMLPAEKMRHLLVVPIELRQVGPEKTLRVAMTDPTNQQLIDDLQFSTSCRVSPVLASEEDIRIALVNNLPTDTSDESFSFDPAASRKPGAEADSGDFDSLETSTPSELDLGALPEDLDPAAMSEQEMPAEAKYTSLLNTAGSSVVDPRLDRLLEILRQKGILSDYDVKQVKSD